MKNLLIAFISLLASLLLGELVLKVFLPPQKTFQVLKPNLHHSFSTDPKYCPGIYETSNYITNSLGMRADELTSDYSDYIFTIGGSTTECLFLDQDEAWPAILEKGLGKKTWVGNIGQSGRGSRHHLLQVRYLLDQHPEVKTVIMMLGINDFAKRLKQGNSYKYLDHSSNEFVKDALGITFRKYPESLRFEVYDPNRAFYKQTAIWRLLRKLKDRYLLRSRQKQVGGQHQEKGCEGLKEVRAKRQAGKPYIEELPDMSDGLREYRNNLIYISEQCKKRNVRLILITQATMWSEDVSIELQDLWWFLQSDGPRYYGPAAAAKGIKMYNDVTLDVCRAENIECIDIAKTFPKDTSVFYDDLHFNEQGAQRVADEILKHLLSH